MNSPTMFYNDLIKAIYHNSANELLDEPRAFFNERVVLTKRTPIGGVTLPAHTVLKIQKPLRP